jgi:hypothetical protein
MIIRLTGATATKHLGGLDFYSIIVDKENGVTVTLDKTTVSKDTAASETVTGTVTVADGYTLSSVVITMGGADITSSCYTESTGAISISGITGNVVVKATATSNSGSGDSGETPTVGTQITTGSLSGAYLYDNYKFNDATMGNYTSIVPDTTNTYFVYDKIPVTPEYSINIPSGRACYFSKSDGTVITGNSQVNLSKQNYTTIVPANAAYISVCFKYADIQPANVTMTMTQVVSWGEPTTTLLKDSGAVYMAETAIETGKTEPTSYSNFYTYHLIPVTGCNKCKLENCRLSIWYDANKQFISQVNFNINSTAATTIDWSHVAPDNAAYLSVCVKVGDIDKDAVAIVEYPRV